LDALELVPPELTEVRVGLAAACAAVEHLAGDHASAHARLVDALASLPDDHGPATRVVMVELAADGLWRTDYDAMRRWANRASSTLPSDRSAGDEALAVDASAQALLALAETALGNPDAATRSLDTATALVDAMVDSAVATHLDVTNNLAHAELFFERFEDAVRHADRGLAIARSTGQGQYFVLTLAARAVALLRLGRLEEASRTASEAVASARATGHAQVLAHALTVQAYVETASGDLDLAVANVDEALDTFHHLGHSVLSAAASWLAGETLLEAGNPAGCAAVVLDLAGGPEAPRLPAGERCVAWYLLTRAFLTQGRRQDARASLTRLEASAPALTPLRLPQHYARRARAHFALHDDQLDRAAAAALAAAEIADRIDARIDGACARLLAGRALAAAGERTRSVQVLDQARTELDARGACRFRDAAARELRKLGHRVPRTGRSRRRPDDLAALSEREHEIAELIAAGRTNKEIGDILYVSTRTVERHVSHIFTKLGVTSRAQLGTRLLESAGNATELN
jgi:ATP/maltotriose-dependent transcriptional regulator MalT